MNLRDTDRQDNYDQVSVEILLADADLALTFTGMALEHTDRRAIARTTQNARTAYDLITRKRSILRLTAEESKSLDAKTALLKERLCQLGEKL